MSSAKSNDNIFNGFQQLGNDIDQGVHQLNNNVFGLNKNGPAPTPQISNVSPNSSATGVQSALPNPTTSPQSQTDQNSWQTWQNNYFNKTPNYGQVFNGQASPYGSNTTNPNKATGMINALGGK